MRKQSFLFGAILSIGAALAVPAPASASLLFTLTEDACSGGCGAPPYGTILLSQDGADTVDVLVTLFSPYMFVKTGAGDSLAFSLFSEGTISITNLTAGFVVDPTSPIHASAFGYFEYGIDWNGGPGGSSPSAGPLYFEVTDSDGSLTPYDFITSVTKQGASTVYFLASDIGALGPGGNGNTGNVAALAPCDTTDPRGICFDEVPPPRQIPEPSTLALLGAGLFSLAIVRRRRTKA